MPDSAPIMVESHLITQIESIAQPGGYQLLNVTLSGLAIFEIGCTFWLENAADNHLFLFQQSTSSDNVTKVQLLGFTSVLTDFLETNKSQRNLYCCRPAQKQNRHQNNGNDNQPLELAAFLSFRPTDNVLLLGSDARIANTLLLARLRQNSAANPTHPTQTLALLEAEQTFPFVVKPARFIIPYLPAEAIGACPLLEDWKIGNRLASPLGLPGCYEGNLIDLLMTWLSEQAKKHTAPERWLVMGCLPLKIQKKCQEICQPYDWLDFTGIHYCDFEALPEKHA